MVLPRMLGDWVLVFRGETIDTGGKKDARFAATDPFCRQWQGASLEPGTWNFNFGLWCSDCGLASS
jgi:hypothetical protein